MKIKAPKRMETSNTLRSINFCRRLNSSIRGIFWSELTIFFELTSDGTSHGKDGEVHGYDESSYRSAKKEH